MKWALSLWSVNGDSNVPLIFLTFFSLPLPIVLKLAVTIFAILNNILNGIRVINVIHSLASLNLTWIKRRSQEYQEAQLIKKMTV